MLAAAQPDVTVVEMGLPELRPDTSTYVASFGAARSSSRATAEALGLIGKARPT